MRWAKSAVVSALVFGASIGLCTTSKASTFTFVGTDSAGENVNVSATVTALAGGLSISITNLQSNPKSAGQQISSFAISLGGGAGSNGSGATYNGAQTQPQVSIGAGGVITINPNAAVTWGLTSSSTLITL